MPEEAVFSKSQLSYKQVIFHNQSRTVPHTCSAFGVEDVQHYYDALSAFNAILYRPENLYEYQLQPGSLSSRALLASPSELPKRPRGFSLHRRAGDVQQQARATRPPRICCDWATSARGRLRGHRRAALSPAHPGSALRPHPRHLVSGAPALSVAALCLQDLMLCSNYSSWCFVSHSP